MTMFLAIFAAIVLGDLFGRVLDFFQTRRNEALFEQKIERMKNIHQEMNNDADKETRRILEALIKGDSIFENNDDKENGEWKYLD